MTTSVKITPEQFAERVKKAEDKGLGINHINDIVNCKPRFAHAMPATMDQQLKEWFSNTGGKGSLYVHGMVGVGKTHSVMALAKLLYVNKVKSKFYNIVEFLNIIKSYFKYDDCEQSIIDILTTDKTLILDDFGAEKGTEWVQEIVYRLVNLRYEHMLDTIFISNLSPNELSKVYGDRVASRITEMVGGKQGIIKMAGKDKRL